MAGATILTIILAFLAIAAFIQAKGKQKLMVLGVFLAGVFLAATAVGGFAKTTTTNVTDAVTSSVTGAFN